MDTGKMMEQLTAFATTYGLRVIGAILILVLGRIVAGVVRSGVKRVMERAKVDVSLINFVASLVYALVIVFALLAALSKFGVETASFVAVLGAASFAIGFAMQGSLSNFAAGVMLLIFRPFKVGDFIDAAGVAGTVKSIALFRTELATPDNVQIIVPNGKVFGDTIKNFSANDTRRVDLVVGIGYGSNIKTAVDVMKQILESDSRVLSDPAYTIAVSELADSSVNLVVRPWVMASDYWPTRFDLTRQIKEKLDAAGVEIPFPQRVIHQASA